MCIPSNPQILDVRAVFLYSRDVDLRPLDFPISNCGNCGLSMSHYDQICVEQVVLDSPIQSDLLTESPLAQAYQHSLKLSRDSKPPRQEILAFANFSDTEQAYAERFWSDQTQPVFFMTLLNLGPHADLSTVEARIHSIFDAQTLVYFTFDYNDLVIFHKGSSFSEYVHKLLKVDYGGNDSSAWISDSITLYSFPESFQTSSNAMTPPEVFGAYLRMGVANTSVMEEFRQRLLKDSPSTEVNYILGRHDIGFFQPNATLEWIKAVQELIRSTSQEMDKKAADLVSPIWYTTSTLSIRIPPEESLPELGSIVWNGTHIQSALRDSMKTAYEKFCAAYEDTRYEFGITADDVWLTWLKTGVQQAISFLENDLTQELGLCLVPLYQDFLHYSTDLWKKIGTPGIHDYDINQRRVFRREAERNFMDLFQNVSILMDSMNRSSRQFIQTPPFRTTAFSMPPKLMAYYTAVAHQILDALQDDTNNFYGFMIAPSFVKELEVISLAEQRLTEGNQLLSISIGETSIYTLQLTTFYLAHELSHYVGSENRMREIRLDYILKACIQNFLWMVLDDLIRSFNLRICNARNLDTRTPQIGIKCEGTWEKLADLADHVYQETCRDMKDRWEEMVHGSPVFYLQEVYTLAEKAIRKVSKDRKILNAVYQVFWDLIADPEIVETVLASELGENVLFGATVRHFARQEGYHIYTKIVEDDYNCYTKGNDERKFPKQIDPIEDVFRETFADLQAIRLLGLSPNEYLNIFKDEKEHDLVSGRYRDRVLAVLSVLPEEVSGLPDGEFKELLQTLRGRSGVVNNFEELLSSSMNGIVVYYVHEYLKKCLETIDRAFDHDSKVEKLRTLYKELGNQKSVKDLMDTLKQTIKDYQRTLCKC